MSKKEQYLLLVLVLLVAAFALVTWYFNFYQASEAPLAVSQPVIRREEPIKLNNTLKTSVTVLPAPEGTPPAGGEVPPTPAP
jgi:hypothetical protein